MFKKKKTCKLCGVKTTETERCPKCGYSFRTVDRLDIQPTETEKPITTPTYVWISPYEYDALPDEAKKDVNMVYLIYDDDTGITSLPEARKVFGLTVDEAREIFTKMGRV